MNKTLMRLKQDFGTAQGAAQHLWYNTQDFEIWGNV